MSGRATPGGRVSKSKKPSKTKENSEDPKSKLNLTKTYLCGDCNKNILDNATSDAEESIECSVCNKWYHSGCTPLSQSVFDIMATIDNIKYYCPSCEKDKGKERKEFKILMDMIERLEDKLMDRIEKIVEKRVEIKVKEIEKNLESRIEERLDAISVPKIEKKIQIQVEETLEEQREMEQRSSNLIIFNIEENESQENDLEVVREIIRTTTPELLSEGNNIKNENIQRLGNNNQKSNKIRPLKVILPDESFKNQMMKNAKKLRRNAKFNNVFLKNDLTRKQQQLEFDLRQEKKQRTLNGEDVIIFDNKVIPRCQHPNFEPSKQNHVSDKAQNTTESA